MPSEVEALLQSAVVKIKAKVMPEAVAAVAPVHTTAPPHEALYSILEVWDKTREDKTAQEQTQYIFDFLDEAKGDKTVKDKIVEILTKIGTAPVGETRLDRVWKYCKLHKRAQSIMGEYNLVQGDIDALGNNRRE